LELKVSKEVAEEVTGEEQGDQPRREGEDFDE
jgi:hypothetical protein